MKMKGVERRLKRGLIVSCQATEGEPLYGTMHLFARAAAEGGAVGIRALYGDVAAVRKAVSLPVIGLTKKTYTDSEIYITPTEEDVRTVLGTGCEAVAIDATLRPRPNGEKLQDLFALVREYAPNTEIVADVATLKEGENAARLGADYVSTTLRGYTPETAHIAPPDLTFLRELIELLRGSATAVIAEGGVFDAAEMKEIASIDPYAVVIGSAITRPKVITQRFVSLWNGGGEQGRKI